MHYLIIENKLEQICIEHNITIDKNSFQELFKNRLEDDSIKVLRSIEHLFLNVPDIRELIESYYVKKKNKAMEEILELEVEVKFLSEKIAKKSTKTAITEKSRKEKKIQKNRWIIERNLDDKIHDFDNRLYPLNYTALIVGDSNKNILRPFRFQLRPAGENPQYDKESSLYKIKKESLTKKYFDRIRYHAEKPSRFEVLFGKNHGILVVSSFHEYAHGGASISFGFENKNSFFCPCLFDKWTSNKETLASFAIITTQAHQGVLSAGYHRSPIAIRTEYLDRWLHPQGYSIDKLEEMLNDNLDADFRISA